MLQYVKVLKGYLKKFLYMASHNDNHLDSSHLPQHQLLANLISCQDLSIHLSDIPYPQSSTEY